MDRAQEKQPWNPPADQTSKVFEDENQKQFLSHLTRPLYVSTLINENGFGEEQLGRTLHIYME
jgi:hypothetical protein